MNERNQYYYNVNLYIDLQIKCNSNLIACNSFVGIDGIIQKSVQKDKENRVAKIIFQKNNVRRFKTSDFKAYYKATVLKTMWNW